MKVRKAIIPAAGLGTRLLPNTKSIPKEMLPLVDKPVLQYIVEEAVAAGVEQILIKGLGHAIWRAKNFVGNEPFGILLGDDIMLSETPVLKQLVDAAEQNECSAIAIREFPGEEICKYSSVKLEEKLGENVYRIGDMNEKPSIYEKLSDYAIMGRYVLTPAIFDILETTSPGRNNEIQLTDGMRTLCRREKMCAVDFEGRRYDTGNLKGYLESIIDFALKNEEAGPWLRQFILDKAELLKNE